MDIPFTRQDETDICTLAEEDPRKAISRLGTEAFSIASSIPRIDRTKLSDEQLEAKLESLKLAGIHVLAVTDFIAGTYFDSESKFYPDVLKVKLLATATLLKTYCASSVTLPAGVYSELTPLVTQTTNLVHSLNAVCGEILSLSVDEWDSNRINDYIHTMRAVVGGCNFYNHICVSTFKMVLHRRDWPDVSNIISLAGTMYSTPKDLKALGEMEKYMA